MASRKHTTRKKTRRRVTHCAKCGNVCKMSRGNLCKMCGGKKSRRNLRHMSRKVGGRLRRNFRKTSRRVGGKSRRNFRKTSRKVGGRGRRNLRKTSRKGRWEGGRKLGGAPLPVQKKHEESSLRGWMLGAHTTRKRKIAAPPQTPWAYPLTQQPMLKVIWPVDYVLYYVNALSMTPEGVLSLDVTKAQEHIELDLLDLDTRPYDEEEGERKEVRERLDHDLTTLNMSKDAVQEAARRWLKSDFGLAEKEGEDGITVDYLNVDRLHQVAKFIEGKTQPRVATLTLLEKWWRAREKEEEKKEMREELLMEKAKAEELKEWSRRAWSELAQNIVNNAAEENPEFSADWLNRVWYNGVSSSGEVAANWLEDALILDEQQLSDALINGIQELEAGLPVHLKDVDKLIDIIINNISKKAKDAYEQEVPLLPERRYVKWLRDGTENPMSM